MRPASAHGRFMRSVRTFAPAAVREGEQRCAAHVFGCDDVSRLPGGQGAGCLRGNQVAAKAVHAEMGTHGRYLVERLLADVDGGEHLAGLLDTAGQLPVGGGPFRREALRVGFVAEAAADDLDPL